MLSRAKGPSWPASRLSAPLRFAGIPGIVPVLKAYGGFRIAGAAPETPPTLGRLGALEVRLARNAEEIRRAQKLRYRVFYREMSAVPDAASFLSRRDVDPFDAACDHLLVVDHAAPRLRKSPPIVGTYRLLRQEVAERQSGFYTACEFDIDCAGHPSQRAPLSRARPLLRAGRPTATSAPSSCCGTASGPTCWRIAST